MTHFYYNPKDITETELTEKLRELLEKSSFQHGDVVSLKGIDNSPLMSITGLSIGEFTVTHGRLAKKHVKATCTYFNKSSQGFTSVDFSVLCLEKIEKVKSVN